MSFLQYDRLFAPYMGDGHTLENTIKYLSNLAENNNISNDVMELAMNEVFSEIADGKEFPKNECPCGCGINKSATALIHAIRDRMYRIDKDVTAIAKKVIQLRYNLLIEGEMRRISKFDKKYIKMMRPPLKERIKRRLHRWNNRIFKSF